MEKSEVIAPTVLRGMVVPHGSLSGSAYYGNSNITKNNATTGNSKIATGKNVSRLFCLSFLVYLS